MQKSGKLSLLLVLALALSLGLAGSVWAQPMGKGMGPGPGMMNLTPDQAGKIFDLKEKMHTDTAGLRKQMMVKHAELAALWKTEKPDQTAIQAKQKELNTLRDQMQEKMTAFRLEAKKIAPNFGMGMGWAWVAAWAGPWTRYGYGTRRWAWALRLDRPPLPVLTAASAGASCQVRLLNHYGAEGPDRPFSMMPAGAEDSTPV